MINTKIRMKDIQVVGILKQSFEDFKKNWKILLGAFAVIFVLNLAGGFLSSWLSQQDLAVGAGLLNVVLYVVQLTLSVGLIKIALGVVDGRSVKIDLLWESVSDFKLIVYYFLISLIVSLATGVGLLLLVIPGVIVMVRLSLAMYYVVDRMQSPMDALRSSWNATKGLFFGLLIFFIVVGVMNIIAALLLALPLLVTVPVSMVAMARVYRKISAS